MAGNLTLGAGDEENGRPLLGGLGPANISGGGAGLGAAGFTSALLIERIARFATNIIQTGSGGGGAPATGGSSRDPNPDDGGFFS